MRRLILIYSVLVASTAYAAEDLCSHITWSNSDIDRYDCTDQGYSFYVWENIPFEDQPLFTVDDATILKDDPSDACGGYLELSSDKLNVKLVKELDAERGGRPISCSINVGSGIPTYIVPLDINEFEPQPVDGLKVIEVTFPENQENSKVVSFEYTDLDKGETETLSIAWASSEFEENFDISSDEDAKNVFTLSTKEALDYEKRAVYKLEFYIISKDAQGTEKNSNHTVLLFVEDIGDTEPYWVHIEPTASITEGKEGRLVYYVEAADRDFGINNKVKYSITQGNDDGFFVIDELTGEVTLAEIIDHESDPVFFTLTVTAQEYLDDDTIAPDPSSAETITNVNIDDINDESPTFNQGSYETKISEVVDKQVLIDLDMFVCDADSLSDINKFQIVSDLGENVDIDPTDGRGNTTIKLWANPGPDGIFDYETAKQPIVIFLTATELSNSSHFQTVTISITLSDENDHTPIFKSGLYGAKILESQGKGYDVTTVEADDGDKSSEFGKDSIKYSNSDCQTIIDVDADSGKVTLSRNGALDYEDQEDVYCTIYAKDNLGTGEFRYSTAVLNITVIDVNDSPPTITVQNGEIMENSKEGTELDIKISASDPDTNPSLSFDIEWEKSTAYKDGEVVSIDQVQQWFVVVKITDGAESTAVLKVGATKPDRETADTVSLSLMVIDDNTEQGSNKDSGTLDIKILDENDNAPEFVGDYSDLKVLENSEGGVEIDVITATDKDENDAVVFSASDDTYVSIVQDSDFKARLIVSGKTNIDREERETVQITIKIEDKNSQSTTKTFTVNVVDENDNPPIFKDAIIFASFTAYDKIGKSLVIFQATDEDLAEILNYQSENDFEWPDGGPEPPPTVPFRVQRKENNDAEILLNFDPLGVDSGYCNFTVTCLDNNGKHNASITAKVYAITAVYEVAVNYDNPRSYTTTKNLGIQVAFTDVYEFPCIIDSIEDGEDDTKSIVKMHFIDEVNNEPVQAARIIEKSNEYAVSQALISKNQELGLNILSVGNVTPDSGGGMDNVLILEILLGVVSLVLGSLLLLLLTTYFIRTRSLERRLKVATTTTFGSVSSDLNRMDVAGGVPGSNKFAGEGANPMYNLSDSYLRNDDSSSVGSGDSVLVGVEDNPEFRGYSAEPKGQSNPAFSRSIDDVAAPSIFSGVTRTNPLMDMDINGEEDGDLADALQNYELFIRHPSGSSEADSGQSDETDENPNFSFGDKRI